MAIYERPIKQIKTEGRVHTRRHIDALVRSDTRAQQRFAWATFVRNHPGRLAEARIALLEAMTAGTVPMPFMEEHESLDDAAPSAWTLGEWRKLPEERITIEGLRHKRPPNGGRPRTIWEPELQAEFDRELKTGRFRKAAHLWKHLCKFAKKRGFPEPAYEVVRYRMADMPIAQRTVARHGKRAGIADAVVHGVVPAEHAHQVWVLDELDLPIWAKVYSYEAKQIVAVKPVLVIIVDGASGVLLSYYLANPLARGALRGVDRWDIMAAVTSGLFPELAAPACRPYAGWMPRVLRYDKAPAHNEVGARLKQLEVEVPDLPGFAPWHRGLVEAAVKAVKEGCVTIKGHEDFYSIAEYASDRDLTTREAAVRSGERLTERIPVLVESLYSLPQLEREIDGVVREFNEELIHDEFKMPRAARYGLALQAEKLRSGRDAISMLEPHRVQVQKRGIVVNRVAFEERTPEVQFYMGTRVDLRLDPALRGVFALVKNPENAYFLRPKREAALTTSAADVSHATNALVSFYDAQARAAKEFVRQLDVGLEAAELADAVALEQLDGARIIEQLHKNADASGETLRSQPLREAVVRNPAGKRAAAGKRKGKRQAAPKPKPPAALPPGVVAITSAPSLSKGVGESAPPLRRGIITSFR